MTANGDGLRPGALAVSVVIVSRHRARALDLCLTALEQQDHPGFQVVLVADPGSVGIRPDLPLTRVAFDQPNISAARNAGIAVAAGQVVAFLDDDAVAEPTWLSRLTAPFADRDVIAATGVTRGRDGLRWQVRAERMTRDGVPLPIQLEGDSPRLLPPDDHGRPVSTLGTNCAFRQTALQAVGGFDPAFAYHLDESDLNMRIAARFPRALTAIVPGAEVAHGWAGDLRRSAAGVPTDLTAIGRSTAIFCARWGGDAGVTGRRLRARLLSLMVAGRLDPLRLGALMAGFHAGAAMGADTVVQPNQQVILTAVDPDPPLLPRTGPRPHAVLSGWHWQRGSLRRAAAKAAERGDVVTLILLSPSTLRHRRRFDPAGFREQTGGLWGPSQPGDPACARWRFRARVAREAACLSDVRGNAKLS